jgi:hypothetical protein
MPAAVAATIASPEKKGFSKNHQAPVEIKIAWMDWRRLRGELLVMKGCHAPAANAGRVPKFRRHEREQSLRDAGVLAPARAFVSGHGAEPAIVLPAT